MGDQKPGAKKRLVLLALYEQIGYGVFAELDEDDSVIEFKAAYNPLKDGNEWKWDFEHKFSYFSDIVSFLQYKADDFLEGNETGGLAKYECMED